MVPAGNKAKRLSLVNHTTKTIHHHHNDDHQNFKFSNFSLYCNVDPLFYFEYGLWKL